MQTQATTTALLDNNTVVDISQRLLFSEDKPPSFTPLDNLLMDYLIHRRAIDHEIRDSLLTMARRLGCSDRKTIAASLKRLEGAAWITSRGCGKWNTHAIQINFDRLPACANVREKISKEAGQLAVRYKGHLERNGIRKFHKNWLKRSEPSAQRILTQCGGKIGSKLEIAQGVITWAFEQPHWKRLLMRGSLYHVERFFNKILRECELWHQSHAKQQTITGQRMDGGNHNADRDRTD